MSARAALAAVLALLATALLAPAGAQAAYGLKSFGVTFTGPSGEAVTQAGSHPFAMTTSLAANTREEGGKIFLEGSPKDLFVTTPEGLAGIPAATPRCSGAEFAAIQKRFSLPSCPDESAIGLVAVLFAADPGAEPEEVVVPVYNLLPGPGTVLKLGFVIANVPVTAEATLSETPPYRVLARATNVSQTIKFFGSKLTLWGNPADKAHDPYRGSCVNALPTSGEQKEFPGEPISVGDCEGSSEEEALLSTPPICDSPLRSEYATDSWQEPAARLANGEPDLADPDWALGSATSAALEGCEQVLAGFGPEIATAPSSHSSSSPTGLDFDLEVDDPGLTDPAGIATAQIERAEVTLPAGMTINPSQAEGLEVCTESQLGRESARSEPGEGCPQAAKIGSLEAETPQLPGEVLRGAVYVAEPYDNLAGDSLIALYLVIKDRGFGVSVIQPVRIEPDPASGQITAISEGMPQVPLSRVRLRFRGGGRSPLISPPSCGAYATTARFTPWADPGAASTATATFTIDSGPGGAPCPPSPLPFAPGFEAGTAGNAAGSYSPFSMRITRGDDMQDIARLAATLPPGVLGRIAGIPWCPEAGVERARSRSGEHGGQSELDDPSCPAASALGSTLAGAGAGSDLTYVRGTLYLAGPYNGAPLSVVSITPAVAGPFDAGVVVVRVGLKLNPKSGQVEADGAASDPIPHLLQGIPLSLRDLRVDTDRPGFTLNATSCEPSATVATLWGSGSVVDPLPPSPVGLAARYQAAGCAELGFSPKLAITLRGKARRGGNPALRAVVTPRPGQANFSRAAVTLPRSAFLDQGHIKTICTRVQFAAGPGNGAACPPGSRYGYARAWTPLLDGPAQGPVFLRSSDNDLPDLVAALTGPPSAPFGVELSARIDSVRGGIRSIFTGIPDVAVSRFVLDMRGGRKGLIVNSRNLCYKPKRNRARANIRGQNGRLARSAPVVRARTCAKAKRKRHRAHRRAAR